MRCSGCGDYVRQEAAVLDDERVVWCRDCDEINRMVERPTPEETRDWPADLLYGVNEGKAAP